MAFSIYSSKTRKVQPSNSSPPSNSPGPPPSTPQQAGFLKNIRESFKASLHTFTHSPAAPSCALQSALNREDEDNDFVNKNSASSRGLAMNFNTTNLQTVRLREHLASSQGKVEGEEEDGHPLAPIQTMASGVGTPRNAVRFDPFVSLVLKRQLTAPDKPPRLPLMQEITGTVLIADISGFTKLGEKLRVEYGDAEGSAKLAQDVDHVLSEFILMVYAYGGDIIKFAGDALICLFQGDDVNAVDEKEWSDFEMEMQSRERALGCGLSLLELVGDSDNNPGSKAVGFGVHCGICWGDVQLLNIGDESKGPGAAMFMIYGSSVEGAGEALMETSKGEVKIHNTSKLYTRISELPKLKYELPPVNRDTVSAQALPPAGLSYISKLCMNRLMASKNASSAISTDDIRTVSVVFISLPELELDYSDSENLEFLHDVWETLISFTYKYDGFCRDFLFEDKGCTFISVFGALHRGESDELAAVLSAISLKDALISSHGLTTYRIGVSTGEVFCGICGPKVRQDSIVMGSEVNMAARLMCKAQPGSILCSKKIYKATQNKVEFTIGEKLLIKGFEGGFASYTPSSVKMVQSRKSLAEMASHVTHLFGRDAEIREADSFVFKHALAKKGALLLVTSQSGMGKSAFVEALAVSAAKRGTRTNFVIASELERMNSYQTFNTLISDVLCNMLDAPNIASVNYQSAALDRMFSHPQDRIICSIIVPQLAPSFQLKGLGLSNDKVSELLHKAVINLLRKQPAGFFFIDDAQWIDDESWKLLESISSVLATAPSSFQHVICIASRPEADSNSAHHTYESFTAHLDAQDKQFRLGLLEFKAERHSVELGPLEDDVVYSIIADSLQTSVDCVDDAIFDIVSGAADGNPGHTKIFVEWALERGIIVKDADASNKEECASSNPRYRKYHSMSAGELEIEFPKSVNAAILSRIDHLDYSLAESLKVASCIGYRFGEELLSHTLGKDHKQMHDKFIRPLEEKGFIEPLPDNKFNEHFYKFTQHAVYTNFHSLLMGSQKTKIHLKIVNYLESTGCLDDGLLAHHWELSGNHTKAASYFEKATEKSVQAYSLTAAVQFLQKSIALYEQANRELLSGGASSSGLSSSMGMKRASTHAMVEVDKNDQDETDVLAKLLNDANDACTKEENNRRKMLIQRQLGDLLRQMAKYEQAEESLKQCLLYFESSTGAKSDDRLFKVEVLSSIAVLYKEWGDYPAAKAYYEELMELSKIVYKPFDLKMSDSLTLYGEFLRKQQRIEEAMEIHQEALNIRLGEVMGLAMGQSHGGHRKHEHPAEASCSVRSRGGAEGIGGNTTEIAHGRAGSVSSRVRKKSVSALEQSSSQLEIKLSDSYTFIGCCLANKKEPIEAAKRHQEALRLRVKHLSGVHPLLSESLNYVGEAMLLQGHSDLALPYFIRALAIRLVAFGSKHPSVAHVLGLTAAAQTKLHRFHEATLNFVQCIDICNFAFKPGHPNTIPNLFNFAKLLGMKKEFAKARDNCNLALTSHKNAGRTGGIGDKIEEFLKEIEGKEDGDGGEGEELGVPLPYADLGAKAACHNLLVFTDPGRDLDDELAIIYMSSVEKDTTLARKVKLLGVVATFGETEERARLTRGSLDLLGMPNVPVCFGKQTLNNPATCHSSNASSYMPIEGAYVKIEAGSYLKGLLERSEDQSVDVCVIAAMTDLSEFMKGNEELVVKKVRSMNIMGRMGGEDEDGYMVPDDSYNHTCDMDAAKHVFRTCQKRGVKMVLLSRWTAYACPIPRSFYDKLNMTGHPIALRLLTEQKHSIMELWKRACAEVGSVERQELPPRCDKNWFCSTFMGGNGQNFSGHDEIWHLIKEFMMYDPLLCIASVDELRREFFVSEKREINGVVHEMIGVSQENDGIREGCVEALRGYMIASFVKGVALPPLPGADDEEEVGGRTMAANDLAALKISGGGSVKGRARSRSVSNGDANDLLEGDEEEEEEEGKGGE